MADHIDTAQERARVRASQHFVPAGRYLVALDALDAERALTQRATDGWSKVQDAQIDALARAEKAEAERDQALKNLGKVHRVVDRVTAERDQALARLAVVRREMRERCAQAMLDFDYDEAGPQLAGVILDLPLDPDAEAALQRVAKVVWTLGLNAGKYCPDPTADADDIWLDNRVEVIAALKRQEASHE